MSNLYRPSTRVRQQMEDAKEALFTVAVHFKDDAEIITVGEVPESSVVEIYKCLGDAEGRIQLTPRSGFVYMSAANRVKYITATKEESN